MSTGNGWPAAARMRLESTQSGKIRPIHEPFVQVRIFHELHFQYQEPAMPAPPHKDYLPDVTGTENESEYGEEEDDGAPGEPEEYEDEYPENENGN